MIRNAQIADFPEVKKLGKRLIEKTPYRAQQIDTLIASQTFGNCVSSALGFAMVAQHKGEITGMMLGCALPLFYSKARMATDLVLYSERAGDGMAMVRRFIKWAWSIPNVVEVTLSQSSGVDVERTGKLYGRMGLECVGQIYTMARPSVATERAA